MKFKRIKNETDKIKDILRKRGQQVKKMTKMETNKEKR